MNKRNTLYLASSLAGAVIAVTLFADEDTATTNETQDPAAAPIVSEEASRLAEIQGEISWGYNEIRRIEPDPLKRREMFIEFDQLNKAFFEEMESLDVILKQRRLAQLALDPPSVPEPVELDELGTLQKQLSDAYSEIRATDSDPVERREANIRFDKENGAVFERIEVLDQEAKAARLSALEAEGNLPDSELPPLPEDAPEFARIQRQISDAYSEIRASESDPVQRREAFIQFDRDNGQLFERMEQLDRDSKSLDQQ